MRAPRHWPAQDGLAPQGKKGLCYRYDPCVLAAPTPKPVITPQGLTASSRWSLHTSPGGCSSRVSALPAHSRRPDAWHRARHPGDVEGIIGAALGRQGVDEIQKKRHQGRLLLAHLPIVLLPRRQLRKGCSEMALRIAVKAALTAKALPLPEQGQGDHLTRLRAAWGPGCGAGGKESMQKSSTRT